MGLRTHGPQLLFSAAPNIADNAGELKCALRRIIYTYVVVPRVLAFGLGGSVR
jgi:hypothetical protein